MRKIIPAIIFSSIWMMILAFSGCMNEKKALRYYDTHPRLLAKVCGERYVSADLEKDSVSYKQGKTNVLAPDTVTLNINSFIDSFLSTLHDSTKEQLQDSLAAHPIHPIYIHIPCPPASGRVDTVMSFRYVQVSNKAMESYLQYQRDSMATELLQSKARCGSWQEKAEKRSRAIWKLSILLGLLVAGAAVSVYLRSRLKFPV